ncbi:antitoxin HicB [Fusobacterium nucleatum YWH7199]|uniref:type II toxin-antitoxin system HicB family antitoxin n=1 Tax=Fusobacterium nucleatum TaxID=851 RepID=UPI00201A7517|nr:type II toxin-antitoxin system HicB family antitoxin [Fusobacterium nucleatum]MCL4581706.1 antitoxin HicB [Fusobacterium nucleatum YWH7199]
MKEKYIYPCIIYEDDGIYYANFKDFDACFTDGESIEEVIINAKDVLEGTIFSLLKNNLEVPEPTLTKPNLENNEFLVYTDIWLTPIIDKVKNQTVKKTLTIPKWLNDEAEKRSINFSNLLQTAIKKYLNIQ